MAKITPMMQQYFEIKEQYKHCLLFFRLGDFYEMFFEDAVIASKELEITLTGKDWGQEERAPMCGVPFHSADGYIARLVERGYKVAICEQVEDPKTAKGLVKRDVVRVITPGTVVDNTVLDETKNNYILSVFSSANGYGIAVCDVTTGEFQTTEFRSVQAAAKILDETARFSPAELVCNSEFLSTPLAKEIEERFHLYLNDIDSRMYEYNTAKDTLLAHFKVKTLESFGLQKKLLAVSASGALMWYLNETQKNDLSHISALKYYTTGDFMLLDVSSRRNLELTETMREKNKKGSLLSVLDKTQTAMGARLLRKWVEQPLLSKEEINQRLDGVEELFQDLFLREEIKEILHSMYDFERIMSRVVYQNANARDLAALKNSVENLPLLKKILSRCRSPYLSTLHDRLDTLENIHALIAQSIVEDPPFSVREGGMIREGFNEELDTYTKAKENGTTWIHQLEEEEREKTGIKNLKVRYNKVFGYYIEVTKSNLELVPEGYIRKQTLANAERYITPELKELEDMILGAEDKLYALEYELYSEVRETIAAQVERIQKTAKAVAGLDVFTSLALVAERNHYVRPKINEKGIIDIKEGRHPVVEKMIPNDMFISNDTYLDDKKNRISIITGPNMAGKSTYMRQTALIALMAQVGCFVPAQSANIGLSDRIFTRVGASDDLASGQSTFMVEMTEVANILRNATSKSLLILDEIGRGTSTFDGLSIAWAVVEYISDSKLLGAKTLFATHYHELTELEGKIENVNNYCIAVKEKGDDIVFLRKIVKGGADKSYGIQVAKLAGVPDLVINRAKEIVEELSDEDITSRVSEIAAREHTAKKKGRSKKYDEVDIAQMSLFDTVKDDDVLNELKEIDVTNLTPIDALNTLYRLQNKLKNRW